MSLRNLPQDQFSIDLLQVMQTAFDEACNRFTVTTPIRTQLATIIIELAADGVRGNLADRALNKLSHTLGNGLSNKNPNFKLTHYTRGTAQESDKVALSCARVDFGTRPRGLIQTSVFSGAIMRLAVFATGPTAARLLPKTCGDSPVGFLIMPRYFFPPRRWGENQNSFNEEHPTLMPLGKQQNKPRAISSAE